MLQIINKEDCCGCSACVQICPKCCISMYEDNEGFLYPEINKDICVNCHLCENVCPVLHQGNPHQTLRTYAAKNKKEDIRSQSSSGGVFSLLAEYIIDRGGVVFGARFNEKWEVIHDYVEVKEGIAAFRGSKYVQSQIGDSYKKVEFFLKQSREVLFSGTPCQIAGLNYYLRKKYDNLLTVDLVCHGVPSPGVWRKYLRDQILNKDQSRISNIQFRDKRLGWKNFSFTIWGYSNINKNVPTILLTESLKNNVFMIGFLKNLYLRPSCYNCPCRNFKSGSDITIGDYWGVENYYHTYDDDKGVSLVCVNTSYGMKIYSLLMVDGFETPYEYTLSANSCLEKSVTIPKFRNIFWLSFQHEGFDSIERICGKMNPNFIHRAFSWIRSRIQYNK